MLLSWPVDVRHKWHFFDGEAWTVFHPEHTVDWVGEASHVLSVETCQEPVMHSEYDSCTCKITHNGYFGCQSYFSSGTHAAWNINTEHHQGIFCSCSYFWSSTSWSSRGDQVQNLLFQWYLFRDHDINCVSGVTKLTHPYLHDNMKEEYYVIYKYQLCVHYRV